MLYQHFSEEPSVTRIQDFVWKAKKKLCSPDNGGRGNLTSGVLPAQVSKLKKNALNKR